MHVFSRFQNIKLSCSRSKAVWPTRKSHGVVLFVSMEYPWRSVIRHPLHLDDIYIWRRLLETKCVGDKFEMLVTDLIPWENHQHNGKSCKHNDSTTNISNRSLSWSHRHNDVTNITICCHRAYSLLWKTPKIMILFSKLTYWFQIT